MIVPMVGSEMVQVEGARRIKGRPRLTQVEIARKDSAYDLMANIALDRVEWRNGIHVLDSKQLS